MSNPSKITMWKPPPRRDYAPKPMDPGQVVVWTHRIRGYWTVPSRYDPEANTCTPAQGWIPAVDTERIGTIWSDGSSASTWWVLPDDDMLTRSWSAAPASATYPSGGKVTCSRAPRAAGGVTPSAAPRTSATTASTP